MPASNADCGNAGLTGCETNQATVDRQTEFESAGKFPWENIVVEDSAVDDSQFLLGFGTEEEITDDDVGSSFACTTSHGSSSGTLDVCKGEDNHSDTAQASPMAEIADFDEAYCNDHRIAPRCSGTSPLAIFAEVDEHAASVLDAAIASAIKNAKVDIATGQYFNSFGYQDDLQYCYDVGRAKYSELTAADQVYAKNFVRPHPNRAPIGRVAM
jgi:hypothetical protein